MTGVKALKDLVQLVSPKKFPPRSGGGGRKGKERERADERANERSRASKRANERILWNGQFDRHLRAK